MPRSVEVSNLKRVLIVGGSMAGLTAALELLRLGLKPTIYERRPNPREGIICAGGISLWALRRSGLVLPKGAVASRIRSVRIHAPNGHFWQGGAKGRIMACTLWRDRLEDSLAKRVRELGGTIKYNMKVGTQEFRKLAKGYDFVVGADGVMGATRSALNLPRPPPDDIHIGVQRLCALPHHPRDRIDLYFGGSVAPAGFAWVFPVGEVEARVGLGIPLSEKARVHRCDTCHAEPLGTPLSEKANPTELLGTLIKRIGAKPLEPLRAKLIPTAKPMRDPAFGNTLLVGDAGQFCDPFTGGGILGAVASAKAAARAIAEGDPGRYKNHIRWLTLQNTIRYGLKRVLCELSDEELNELVWCLEDLTVHPTRMSLNILRALLALALHKPRLLARHKVLRRMLGLGMG